MKIINAGYEILDINGGQKILRNLEHYGRVCYKSEGKIADTSAEEFVRKLIKNGHESVLEHEKITVRFIVDRGVSHELVRHRLASYSQESTRYCNYSKDGFGREIKVIRPCFWADEKSEEYQVWFKCMKYLEEMYFVLIHAGATPQQARSVLPNSLKTEVIMTANLREWRHVLRRRTSHAAHPQMREVMCPLLAELKEQVPVVFDDITGNDKPKKSGPEHAHVVSNWLGDSHCSNCGESIESTSNYCNWCGAKLDEPEQCE